MFTCSAPDDIRQILSLVRVQRYAAGQSIYSDSDPAENLFLVIKGRVELFKYSPARLMKAAFGVYDRGIFFGIPELFDENYYLNACALEDCEIGCITKSDFLEHVSRVYPFMMDLFKMQAHIITQLQKTLILDNANNRVASYLLWMINESGAEQGEVILVPRTLSFEKMASVLFMTRETVTRIFSKLKKDRILDVEPDRYIILDLQKLKEYSDTSDILTGYYGSL